MSTQPIIISVSPALKVTPQIHFLTNEINSKLFRVKAKLKFININQKQSYEKNLKNFASRDSFSMYNDEDMKVFCSFMRI